jgi:hypothetical protein
VNEIVNNTKTLPQRNISQWLFNPFTFVAGYQALLLGLGIMLISAFIGFLGNTHFDGVLDAHKGLEAPLWYFLAEGIIDWMSIVMPLFFFGLIVSNSSFRIIDVFGTQALARWPYLITSIVTLPKATERFGIYLLSRFTSTAASVTMSYTDMLIFIFALLVAVIMVVWMVALMYRAYVVSCNIKGVRAIITFIISLTGAEVLSKLSILLLFERLF